MLDASWWDRMRKSPRGIDSSFVGWRGPFRFRLSLKASFPSSGNASIYERHLERRGVLIDSWKKRCAVAGSGGRTRLTMGMGAGFYREATGPRFSETAQDFFSTAGVPVPYCSM